MMMTSLARTLAIGPEYARHPFARHRPICGVLARGLLVLLAASVAGMVPASADPALKLKQGDIFTDPVGSVMGVSVVNEGQTTIGAAVVTCDFTVSGKAVGTASTTIYNIVAGSTGKDQVHLMGSAADAARCTISSTAPAAN
ncbi:hypothetical protein J2X65_003988 [Ancylobacter sp. 3268]|uniref:hypothetical protein n=1 Tax=Ancylobacter sp. 3268 TaxID=2817752 RepID=UPI00286016D0|nr:hypothetical protein [Ancylobacter sp. 3268]MDR6954614.1 hypothetical protein [Ancylobacter sp. 3268]